MAPIKGSRAPVKRKTKRNASKRPDRNAKGDVEGLKSKEEERILSLLRTCRSYDSALRVVSSVSSGIMNDPSISSLSDIDVLFILVTKLSEPLKQYNEPEELNSNKIFPLGMDLDHSLGLLDVTLKSIVSVLLDITPSYNIESVSVATGTSISKSTKKLQSFENKITEVIQRLVTVIVKDLQRFRMGLAVALVCEIVSTNNPNFNKPELIAVLVEMSCPKTYQSLIGGNSRLNALTLSEVNKLMQLCGETVSQLIDFDVTLSATVAVVRILTKSAAAKASNRKTSGSLHGTVSSELLAVLGGIDFNSKKFIATREATAMGFDPNKKNVDKAVQRDFFKGCAHGDVKIIEANEAEILKELLAMYIKIMRSSHLYEDAVISSCLDGMRNYGDLVNIELVLELLQEIRGLFFIGSATEDSRLTDNNKGVIRNISPFVGLKAVTTALQLLRVIGTGNGIVEVDVKWIMQGLCAVLSRSLPLLSSGCIVLSDGQKKEKMLRVKRFASFLSSVADSESGSADVASLLGNHKLSNTNTSVNGETENLDDSNLNTQNNSFCSEFIMCLESVISCTLLLQRENSSSSRQGCVQRTTELLALVMEIIKVAVHADSVVGFALFNAVRILVTKFPGLASAMSRDGVAVPDWSPRSFGSQNSAVSLAKDDSEGQSSMTYFWWILFMNCHLCPCDRDSGYIQFLSFFSNEGAAQDSEQRYRFFRTPEDIAAKEKLVRAQANSVDLGKTGKIDFSSACYKQLNICHPKTMRECSKTSGWDFVEMVEEDTSAFMTPNLLGQAQKWVRKSSGSKDLGFGIKSRSQLETLGYKLMFQSSC